LAVAPYFADLPFDASQAALEHRWRDSPRTKVLVKMMIGAANECGCRDTLDAEFSILMRLIEIALVSAPRYIRVRGEQWAFRIGLLSSTPQRVLRRDRNLQAELLLGCIEDGEWVEPFDHHPPETPLQKLPPHAVCAAQRRRLQRIERSRLADHGTKVGSIAVSEPYKFLVSDVLDGPAPEPCDTYSLAGAAAVAVGKGCGVQHGVSTPPAYAGLAARIVNLQEENSRLRKRIRVAQRCCSAGARELKENRLRQNNRPLSPFPSTRKLTSVERPKLVDAHREVNTLIQEAPTPLKSSKRDRKVDSNAVSGKVGSRLRSASQPAITAPGEPPLESDTEGFLRYLGDFQEYTDSLVAAALQTLRSPCSA